MTTNNSLRTLKSQLLAAGYKEPAKAKVAVKLNPTTRFERWVKEKGFVLIDSRCDLESCDNWVLAFEDNTSNNEQYHTITYYNGSFRYTITSVGVDLTNASVKFPDFANSRDLDSALKLAQEKFNNRYDDFMTCDF